MLYVSMLRTSSGQCRCGRRHSPRRPETDSPPRMRRCYQGTFQPEKGQLNMQKSSGLLDVIQRPDRPRHFFVRETREVDAGETWGVDFDDPTCDWSERPAEMDRRFDSEDVRTGRLDALRAEDGEVQSLHPSLADDDFDVVAVPPSASEHGSPTERIRRAGAHGTLIGEVSIGEPLHRGCDWDRETVQIVRLSSELDPNRRSLSRREGGRYRLTICQRCQRRTLG